ncbi:cupin-like domain-containing protein [Bisporella sp. PMI_857]|nr:cupin-like domain-containing protein [Bisporella sp. PMI_857]
MTDPIIQLLATYSEHNSHIIHELSQVPTPLEFMRYVAKNRPFVVRGGASGWRATKEWNILKLKELMEGKMINVAVTPNGKADSPSRTPNGDLVFVLPLEEEQLFDEFIDFVATQGINHQPLEGVQEVRYAQTQNDNLRNEYDCLLDYVHNDIDWARVALNRRPDAVNLWIGNSLSTTALHKDPYENIYVQLIGRKHFVLLPSLAQPCVNERSLPQARYTRMSDGSFKILEYTAEDHVPVACWDPVTPELGIETTKYSNKVNPIRLTLDEGDMLYLPALWYHKVSQTASREGICCAANYWYDIEFEGHLWAVSELVRNVGVSQLSVKREEDEGASSD